LLGLLLKTKIKNFFWAGYREKREENKKIKNKRAVFMCV
jgi:hypothetical protein